LNNGFTNSLRQQSELVSWQSSWNVPLMLYTPLEHLQIGRPIYRIKYIAEACRDCIVLDLGAMDETAYTSKRGWGAWLHEEIAKAARRVIGIDSSTLIPEDGIRTAPHAVIMRGDVGDIAGALRAAGVDPDIIVAGELIEHLENPLSFLRAIRNVQGLRGKRLILSTPNATAIHNCLIGLLNRESTHRDHLCILSFKTLNTLFERAGYESWTIIPYHADFLEMKERTSGIIHRAVAAGEAVIRMTEWCFPLLSFGYIVEAVI
jgi:hypothetical protein